MALFEDPVIAPESIVYRLPVLQSKARKLCRAVITQGRYSLRLSNVHQITGKLKIQNVAFEIFQPNVIVIALFFLLNIIR